MRRSILLAIILLSLSACAFKNPGAEAVLKPTRGNTAAGTMTFSQQGEGVLIKGHLTGLAPGAHGLNIHEIGDCAKAGGHFNPFGKRHGDLSRPDHHAGDLPMLVAGSDGTARFTALMDGISLEYGPGNILGRSIIVHARPDDFTTQPTGNSGPGVACGVIKAQ
ncbi:MAG: superoxide dismutase [Deltaproteobacteria bacterium HGW-Deltaproteobacteria-8]|jgi:Cu-Zn family superoxide dismutase|nr:MAG: superoxide dismutase [Deltaproteobacteria bacterium HGW-Deltaproteobacteria-8]